MSKHRRRLGVLAVAGASAVVVGATTWGLGASTEPATASTAATPAASCRLADLRATVDRAGPQGYDHVLEVSWTNVSSAPCTMHGFGGMDLQGTTGGAYSVPRAPANPPTVDLAPGEKAFTDLYYQPGDRTPGSIAVTPPDETRSAVLPWPAVGGVAREGAFLEPVFRHG